MTPTQAPQQPQWHLIRPHLQVAISDAKLAACQPCADIRVDLGIHIRVDAQQHLHLLTNLQQSKD